MKPTEIVLEVTGASDGGFDAGDLGHAIFTQGGDWHVPNNDAWDA